VQIGSHMEISLGLVSCSVSAAKGIGYGWWLYNTDPFPLLENPR